MYGTNWFSFKHNAWATVTSEPVTKRGYYTVELSKQGFITTMFRRYNAERILSELSDQQNIDAQLDAQLGVSIAGNASSVSLPASAIVG